MSEHGLRARSGLVCPRTQAVQIWAAHPVLDAVEQQRYLTVLADDDAVLQKLEQVRDLPNTKAAHDERKGRLVPKMTSARYGLMAPSRQKWN